MPRPAAAAFGFEVGGVLLAVALWPLALMAIGGHCGYTPGSATWEDRALYDAMHAVVLGDGDDFRFVDAVGDLPFTPRGLAAGDTARLNMVYWYPPIEEELISEAFANTPPFSAFVLSGEATVTVRMDERGTPEQLRAFFDEFARKVTLAPEATRQAWADGLLANRTADGSTVVLHSWDDQRNKGDWSEVPAWSYRVDLHGPLRLDDLYNESQSDGGAWSFHVTIPAWRLTSHDGPELQVDQAGHVSFRGHLPGQEDVEGDLAGAKANARYEAFVREQLTDWGLPHPTQPTPEGSTMQVSGSIC